MDERNYKIINLIQRFLLDGLSEEEQKILDAWRSESEKHELFFRHMCRGENLRDRQKVFKEIDTLNVYKYFKLKTRKRGINIFYRYAAMICLPLLAGGIWMFVGNQREETNEKTIKIVKTIELEKRDKVILVLADGEKVGMTEIQQDSLRVGTAVVIGGESKLVYDSDGRQQDSIISEIPEMNKVITTTGGFYSLILSDGTQVWLNSESELEYPVLFGKGERVVKLVGEAFFEVAKEFSRPFIVETEEIRTRVLGTSFNIKAYKNEPSIATTLFTGRVEVSSLMDSTCHVVLTPGQQVDWDLQLQRLSVQQTRLDHVLAWKEGVFLFNKENIEVVTRQIERWYGVKFIYELDHLEQYTLNGYFSKDESLESILNILTFTGGLKFEIHDNVVHVKK